MDLGSVIIGAVLLAICAVPFLLMGQKRKKRDRQTLQLLFNRANQEKCTISQHEICGDFVIGIEPC